MQHFAIFIYIFNVVNVIVVNVIVMLILNVVNIKLKYPADVHILLLHLELGTTANANNLSSSFMSSFIVIIMLMPTICHRHSYLHSLS